MKISLTLSIIASLFTAQAYAQSTVLSCTVKEASGKFHPQVTVNTILDIPLEKLTAIGSNYEGNNIIEQRYRNETQNITINRATGEFQYISTHHDGFKLDSKNAKGICESKKLKM